jgi:DNA-binding protein H-NS
MNFKTMSVAELLSLRAELDRQLQTKQAELEAQLDEIRGYRSAVPRGPVKGSRIAAKYRNPVTGETWSGRGAVAKWLAAEIQNGKRIEDFLIKAPVSQREDGK